MDRFPEYIRRTITAVYRAFPGWVFYLVTTGWIIPLLLNQSEPRFFLAKGLRRKAIPVITMRFARKYRRWRVFLFPLIRRRACLLVLITVAAVVMFGLREREARLSAGGIIKEGRREDLYVRVKEKFEILPIDIPFLQSKGEWMLPGKGISMCSNGEPKSGTTWTEGVITELAVRLCGSPFNPWCRMGGLVVEPHHPAPNYIWEMVNADTGELFMHFNGRSKHEMVGLSIEDCNPRGKQHRNEFDTRFPCKTVVNGKNTRESITECLPDTSERCTQLMPSRDPSVLRVSVVFRDPREVVISEHRMRIDYYKKMDTSELNPFIYERFEQLVSWQYYRWMWHTTYYQDASHIVIYEDIKSKPEALMNLASFMGLKSSPELMQEVLDNQQNGSPHGDYNTYGLPLETLEYMNATMSKLLPERLLDRYGLSPSFA